MKNLITMYQKYYNHISIACASIAIILFGIQSIMVLQGDVIPNSCVFILLLLIIFNLVIILSENIDNIRYGEDEHISENEYQIIINVRDAENTDVHELIEKINKALNQSDDI